MTQEVEPEAVLAARAAIARWYRARWWGVGAFVVGVSSLLFGAALPSVALAVLGGSAGLAMLAHSVLGHRGTDVRRNRGILAAWRGELDRRALQLDAPARIPGSRTDAEPTAPTLAAAEALLRQIEQQESGDTRARQAARGLVSHLREVAGTRAAVSAGLATAGDAADGRGRAAVERLEGRERGILQRLSLLASHGVDHTEGDELLAESDDILAWIEAAAEIDEAVAAAPEEVARQVRARRGREPQ